MNALYFINVLNAGPRVGKAFPPSSWEYAAAAAAKSRQSCLTLCDPIDGSPPGSPIPGILLARTLEWVDISFSDAWKWKVKVKLLSRVWLLATPWTAAYQAPLSMGFSRQEYWSGVPLPFPKHQIVRTQTKETTWIQDLASNNHQLHLVQHASFKEQAKQKYKPNHQQTGLPPHSALPIRGKTNKQTKTQHKSHPLWSSHKLLDQP